MGCQWRKKLDLFWMKWGLLQAALPPPSGTRILARGGGGVRCGIMESSAAMNYWKSRKAAGQLAPVPRDKLPRESGAGVPPVKMVPSPPSRSRHSPPPPPALQCPLSYCTTTNYTSRKNRQSGVVLMLGQRLRRWPTLKQHRIEIPCLLIHACTRVRALNWRLSHESCAPFCERNSRTGLISGCGGGRHSVKDVNHALAWMVITSRIHGQLITCT